ncbi:hypothetical protein BZG36_05268 [Bifiguratus adelaidae]|uniref:polynucleotide adenylyltransferase n=1 Tax=Bifiguratus adelaidae TaxID=1938954 RepID=A0A261XTM3_9FUNG|nr:hypothetical protein BZG36_05268 [Bifiguratus adelaidae]
MSAKTRRDEALFSETMPLLVSGVKLGGYTVASFTTEGVFETYCRWPDLVHVMNDLFQSERWDVPLDKRPQVMREVINMCQDGRYRWSLGTGPYPELEFKKHFEETVVLYRREVPESVILMEKETFDIKYLTIADIIDLWGRIIDPTVPSLHAIMSTIVSGRKIMLQQVDTIPHFTPDLTIVKNVIKKHKAALSDKTYRKAMEKIFATIADIGLMSPGSDRSVYTLSVELSYLEREIKRRESGSDHCVRDAGGVQVCLDRLYYFPFSPIAPLGPFREIKMESLVRGSDELVIIHHTRWVNPPPSVKTGYGLLVKYLDELNGVKHSSEKGEAPTSPSSTEEAEKKQKTKKSSNSRATNAATELQQTLTDLTTMTDSYQTATAEPSTPAIILTANQVTTTVIESPPAQKEVRSVNASIRAVNATKVTATQPQPLKTSKDKKTAIDSQQAQKDLKATVNSVQAATEVPSATAKPTKTGQDTTTSDKSQSAQKGVKTTTASTQAVKASTGTTVQASKASQDDCFTKAFAKSEANDKANATSVTSQPRPPTTAKPNSPAIEVRTGVITSLQSRGWQANGKVGYMRTIAPAPTIDSSKKKLEEQKAARKTKAELSTSTTQDPKPSPQDPKLASADIDALHKAYLYIVDSVMRNGDDYKAAHKWSIKDIEEDMEDYYAPLGAAAMKRCGGALKAIQRIQRGELELHAIGREAVGLYKMMLIKMDGADGVLMQTPYYTFQDYVDNSDFANAVHRRYGAEQYWIAEDRVLLQRSDSGLVGLVSGDVPLDLLHSEEDGDGRRFGDEYHRWDQLANTYNSQEGLLEEDDSEPDEDGFDHTYSVEEEAVEQHVHEDGTDKASKPLAQIETRQGGKLGDFDFRVIRALQGLVVDGSSDVSKRKGSAKKKETVSVAQYMAARQRNLAWQWHMLDEKKLAADGGYLQSFSTNMETLMKNLSPNIRTLRRRERLIARVTQTLRAKWPNDGLDVQLFGSSVSKLDYDDADLDLCIVLPHLDAHTTPPHLLQRQLLAIEDPTHPSSYYNMNVIAEILRQAGMTKVIPISGATVPIVKFNDPESNLACDINTNNVNGIENTKLIATYCNLDQRIRPFLFTIKYWAKRRHINDPTHNTLSSYTYVLLALFYLMQRGIIPNLQEEQHLSKCPKSIVWTNLRNEWHECNVSFVKTARMRYSHQGSQDKPVKVIGDPNSDRAVDFVVKHDESSLAGLLHGFYAYYAYYFDMENDVVSLRSGHPIPKASKSDWYRNPLCVEDPFIVNRNVARMCTRSALPKIAREFERAARLLEDNRPLGKLCEEGRGQPPPTIDRDVIPVKEYELNGIRILYDEARNRYDPILTEKGTYYDQYGRYYELCNPNHRTKRKPRIWNGTGYIHCGVSQAVHFVNEHFQPDLRIFSLPRNPPTASNTIRVCGRTYTLPQQPLLDVPRVGYNYRLFGPLPWDVLHTVRRATQLRGPMTTDMLPNDPFDHLGADSASRARAKQQLPHVPYQVHA